MRQSTWLISIDIISKWDNMRCFPYCCLNILVLKVQYSVPLHGSLASSQIGCFNVGFKNIATALTATLARKGLSTYLEFIGKSLPMGIVLCLVIKTRLIHTTPHRSTSIFSPRSVVFISSPTTAERGAAFRHGDFTCDVPGQP